MEKIALAEAGDHLTRQDKDRLGSARQLSFSSSMALRTSSASRSVSRAVRSQAVSGRRRVAGAGRVRRFVASARPIFRLRSGKSRSS